MFSKKSLCAVFHGGLSLRKNSKNQRSFKIPKMRKNRSQKYTNVFWTCFGGNFSDFFLPSVPWRVESTASLTLNTKKGDSICRKVGKKLKLRWPALHAIILHCGTKSAMIAPPNALTDSYTPFVPKTQPYLNSMTRTPKSKPYITTLPKNNLSWNIGG